MDDEINDLTIKEIIKENSYSPKTCSEIDHFLRDSQQVLKNAEPLLNKSLSDLKWLENELNLKFPIENQPAPKNSKTLFNFWPPQNFVVLMKCLMKPKARITLGVEIPEKILSQKDCLNQAYFRKRALFLCVLASKLGDFVEKTEFSGPNLNPVLNITPKGSLEHKITVILQPMIPENFWKLSRFDLKMSNLRHDDQEQDNFPTPFYNQTILKDILAAKIQEKAGNLLKNVPNLEEGLKLVNLFLKLRFGDGFEAKFDQFVPCFLCFMIKNGRLRTQSCTKRQIFRSFLTAMGQSDLDQNGASLADREIDLEEFRRNFKVVFVDFSGTLNLCYDWSILTYRQLKRECSLALEKWNFRNDDYVTEILTRKTSFFLKFDAYFGLKFDQEKSKFWTTNELIDVANDKNPLFANKVIEILDRGLGSRISAMDFRMVENSNFIFGLSLNEDNYANLVDKGPSADSPEASDFRNFWGEKAEMRKFADSSICETCVWGTNETKMYGRTVVEKIVKYILKRHLNLEEDFIQFFGGSDFGAKILRKIQPKIEKKAKFLGTGEEEFKYLSQIYDEFAQSLRLLENLPLNINKISPVSTYLRRTEVFPILPFFVEAEKSKYYIKDSRWLLPRPSAFYAPPYCPTLEVQLTLESSGKWPDDLDAVRKLKTAFYCQISLLINKQMNIKAAAREDCVLVFYKGYVFRLIISYFREVILLKRQIGQNEDDPQIWALNLEINEKPKLAGQIYSLVQKFPSYALACRFFKKWTSSHMLSDYLCPELQELLVASAYLHPEPYERARSGLTGFLRTLHILATHDWLTSPLIVNLNEEIDASQMEKIRADFLKLRPTLPPMCLVTPQDLRGVLWTRPTPSALILDRLTRLASASLELVEKNAISPNFDIQAIFRTQTEIYDVLLFLDERQIAKRYLPDTSINRKKKKCKKQPKRLLKNKKSGPNLFPVLDYDPVEFLVRDIQAKFTNLLCFYDKYGGSVVGILFRPNSKSDNEEKIQEFTENIQTIGDKMIRRIEFRR